MSMNTNLAIFIDAPFLAVDEYARRTGQTTRSVKLQCQQGKLPVRKRNSDQEKYYVNNALLIKQALEAEY